MATAVDGLSGTERHWRAVFAGVETLERLFPAVAADAAQPRASHPLTTGADAEARLAAAAKRWGVGLDTLVAGAWALVLALRSGRDDVVYGHAAEGVGPAPLRVRLDCALPVSAWLRELRAQWEDASAHLDVGLDDIRRWVVGDSGGELFDSAVSFGSGADDTTGVALHAEPEPGSGLRLELRATPQELSAPAAEGVLAVLERTLSRLTAEHEPLVGDLVAAASGVVPLARTSGTHPGAEADALMSSGTRAALLAGVCRGDDEEAEHFVSVQEMFEAVVRERPDAVAVEAPDGELTFAALDARARSLGERLREHGAGAETTVAVVCERTGDLVAAMLGIWAAGAAFLLVDPAEPERRTAEKFALAGVRLVVADDTHTRAAERTGLPVVPVTADAATAPGEPAPYPRPLPQHLAYAVFTSGSTGNPKGVLIDHRGLAEHIRTQLAPVYRRVSPDGAGLRVGGAAPVTFDSFIDQVLPMVALGHRLVLFDEMQRRDPGSFLFRTPGTELDVVDCSPSQLSLLVEFGLLRTPLKLVVFGGEKPGQELWQALRAADVTAVSIYGATECSIGSVEADVHRDERVCLGRPAGSGTVYVLSPDQRLLPPGLTGEIYLGGPGVGRGYAGDPAHTARAFVPDPFSGVPGARMYRTGDVGRVAPDGRLVFLGRVDDQLKISGYRIEPAEIEAALDAVSGVRRSAVLPVRGVGADQLVGFVECEPDFDAERAKQELGARLPSYMVPKRLVPLDSLPLTHNGKVDRKRLAEMGGSSE
ncbi:amino acid adenylation domain-containing protein [Streptomyces sp. NBC_01565]|uniref:amino acid adenylation domain-containing protein n=1 Tax=unclassified Streptomyces TaxID=2593676 RepID=UPI002257EB31|nr:amino acid adenylation domain-containing protein [Streptomyces sp. NBC_01565]MCX4539346.1 amino acid adenylation domain-containing protein [Streptomyces sp. NBC_01565]